MNVGKPPYPGAITLSEAARITGKSRQAILRAVQSGTLPATKGGSTGKTTPYWVDSLTLRRFYPESADGPRGRRPSKRKLQVMAVTYGESADPILDKATRDIEQALNNV